ncbi:hypothetical protein DBA29_00695 [Xenophilus aerolatus]|nr:hypothetical protein [Xenophilus aerolatus]
MAPRPSRRNAEPNVFLGNAAGAFSSQGGGVAIGLRAGQSLVGYNNMMFGYQAGLGGNGSYNVGVGANAATGIVGDHNIAQGAFSLQNVQGDHNTAVGSRAGQNFTGTVLGKFDDNTAIGYRSGQNMKAGANTAIGSGAGREIQGAARNETYTDGTVTNGTFNTAVGANAGAAVNGTDNTALGTSAGIQVVGTGNVAVGKYAGQGVTATDTIAVGTNAKAVSNQSTAVGAGASANNANAVALGSNSVTAAAVGTASTTILGTTYAFAGINPGSTVSVGSAGAERTVTNVAAGRISASSTDAINGSQLYATNQAITNVAGQLTHYYSVNDKGVQGPNYKNDGATGSNALAAGVAASATGANATAIGASARALNGGDTAIGSGSRASGGGSVAIGDLASAAGSESLAFGSGTIAGGAGSMALGTTASSFGDYSVALGAFAAAWKENAVAIGIDATANNANDVALGSNSVTAAAVGTTSTTINGVTYNFAGTTPTSTVSVGSVGAERTITNVAAGRISATSTDAINGSQLYATNQAITETAGKLTHYYSVNDGGTQQANYNNDGATGTNSLAAGVGAGAAGAGAVAVGQNTSASVADGVALGSYSVANRAAGMAGYDPTTGLASTNTSSTWQGTLGAFSVGDAATNRTRQITGVAAGTADTDAVNVAQLQALQNNVNTSINIAANKWVTGSQTTTYVAPSATGVESTAVGSGSVASGANSVAVGTGAAATTANSVALGNGSTTGNAVGVSGTTINGTSYSFAGSNPTGVVSVGSAGNERQIQNVAAGQLSATSTDAVNGSQLYATNQAISQVAATAGAGINVTTAATGTGIAVGTSVAKVGPGGTATYTAGNNVVITQNGTNMTFAVNDNPNFTSVTVGNTSVTNNGVTINGGPSMTVNGINAGNQTITNVAPGVNGTDAVNVNQLNQSSAANRAYTDYRAAQLNDRIDGVAKNAYAGVAAAMAVQMPGTYVPGKTVMRIGYGVFKGESAVGVSFRRTAENNGWSLTGGVGLSRAGAAATVGAEWVFN